MTARTPLHATNPGRPRSAPSRDRPVPPPPGWYADPREPDMLRWWSGERWTDDVAVAGGPVGIGSAPDVGPTDALPATAAASTGHGGPTHAHGHLVHEALQEADVVAEDVSVPVVVAWFVLVTLLAVGALLAGDSFVGFAMKWVAPIVAVAGGLPFWRGGHRTIATIGVVVTLLVPIGF